jgi:hypothetical protein
MPTRKDEAVASHPLWVARSMSQVARPDGIRHRGGAHWKPGVTRVGLLYSVCREETEGVNGFILEFVCHVMYPVRVRYTLFTIGIR